MAHGTTNGIEDQNIPGQPFDGKNIHEPQMIKGDNIDAPNIHPQKRDPGLQPERTRQAWDRTLFVMLLDGVFFLRVGTINGNIFTCLAGGLLLLLTLGVVLARRYTPAYKKNRLKNFPPLLPTTVSATVIIVCALTCIGIIWSHIGVFAR